MKSFKNYIAEATDDNRKIVDKLEKTRTSIHSHWKRGGESYHKHALRLIYRYNDLKNKLRDTPEGNQHWKEYCARHKFDTTHAGHDHYV
jgi:hypothetical protein